MSHGCKHSSNRILTFAKKYPWLFPLTGMLALVWFLVRVIPKPSRLLYPCQQIVAPLASGFIAWIIAPAAGIFPSVLAFQIGKKRLRNARYAGAIAFFVGAMVLYAGFLFVKTPAEPVSAEDAPFVADATNEPMGTPRGVNPGRVVWVHDPGAVEYNGAENWWDDSNLLPAAVDGMMEDAILNLAGTDNLTDAWDAIIRNFNQSYGRGDVGYQPGEKIAVKLNMNRSLSYEWKSGMKQYVVTPQSANALVKQLIEVVGVAGSDITLYDASRCVGRPVIDKIQSNEGQDYQDVNYVVNPKYSEEVYTKAVHDESHPIVFADSTMQDYNQTYMPTCVTEASYHINFATFKGHSLAGVTFNAKNFFGSVYHPSCIDAYGTFGWTPNGTDTDNPDTEEEKDGMWGIHGYVNPFYFTGYNLTARPMGSYNAFVDLMGHEHLGGKVMLCLIDGTYSTQTQAGNMAKWESAPFNNDWTSSLFASQDFVAIESVCMDFLIAEPSMKFIKGSLDNYLHEASQADDPPSGTFYDPEGDGTPLASLGVHEHWNNATDKQYSRNLGTGEGIELVKVFSNSAPPAIPQNLVKEEGPGKVSFSWDSLGEGVTYTVKCKTINGSFEVVAEGLTEPSYVDEDLEPGIMLTYVISGVNQYGEGETLQAVATPQEVVAVDEQVAFKLALNNFPNPFNPSTRLNYTVPEDGRVNLTVFNLVGQRMATLVETHMTAGEYSVNWHGVNDLGERASAGVYIVRLQAGKSVASRKITLLY